MALFLRGLEANPARARFGVVHPRHGLVQLLAFGDRQPFEQRAVVGNDLQQPDGGARLRQQFGVRFVGGGRAGRGHEASVVVEQGFASALRAESQARCAVS